MIILILIIICIVVVGKFMMTGSARNSFTRDLLPDERVLTVCRKNWTCFLNRKSIIGWFIGSLVVYIFIIPGIFAFIISLPCALIPTILEYKNTELVLTNERLRGKQGAFNIRTVENKASYFVGNVKTESNAILSSLGSDTIIIESQGVAPFVFTHMKDASKMSSALYSLGSGQEIHVVNRF